MDNKRKKRPKKPKNDSFSFPKPLLDALSKAGLDTRELLFCATSDMDNNALFRFAWLSFDSKGLYIAFGTQQITKAKRKSRRIQASYTVEELVSYPISAAEKLTTEKYVSTGRLLLTENGEERSLTRFSLGCLGDIDEFARVFNEYKKGGDFEEIISKHKKKPECPKCGTPYPDSREICPKCSKKSSVARRLIGFFGAYTSKVLAIIGTMLVGTAITIYTPQLTTRSLYDDVLANPDGLSAPALISALGVLVLSIIGVRLLNTLFTVFYQYMLGSIIPWITYDIKVKIFESMQRLSVNFYSSKQTGSLMERVTRDATNIYWFFVDGLPYIVVNSVTIIGILVVMFLMSWKLSLMTLGITPFLLIAVILGDRFFRRLHHRNWQYSARLSSLVSDNINGQRIIKAFSKENEEYNRFGKMSGGVLDSELKLANSEATLFPILYIFVMSLTSFVMGYGGVLVVRGELTTGTLLSFIVYIGLLQGPLDFMSWVSNWWARCADSAQRVFEICDAVPDITEKPDATELERVNGGVEINELVFEYEPARPVIKKLNMSVAPGEMLGIVGKTGAGKTTIANLIARLYDTKEGTVKIDGVDVRDLRLAQLRSNIGLVSQDIYLFIGTIADNIRYAKPEATMDEVIAAAKAASAHEFIMKLPDAYETRVGAGGQDLSGGERQRVSIARTVIQNPKILILDEATAAMDTETERNIQNSLTRLKEGRTTIAIAHRLSTLRDADYLAVIDDGKITEYGTFSELIKKKGEFYKQYRIQSEALKTIGIGE